MFLHSRSLSYTVESGKSCSAIVSLRLDAGICHIIAALVWCMLRWDNPWVNFSWFRKAMFPKTIFQSLFAPVRITIYSGEESWYHLVRESYEDLENLSSPKTVFTRFIGHFMPWQTLTIDVVLKPQKWGEESITSKYGWTCLDRYLLADCGNQNTIFSTGNYCVAVLTKLLLFSEVTTLSRGRYRRRQSSVGKLFWTYKTLSAYTIASQKLFSCSIQTKPIFPQD